MWTYVGFFLQQRWRNWNTNRVCIRPKGLRTGRWQRGSRTHVFPGLKHVTFSLTFQLSIIIHWISPECSGFKQWFIIFYDLRVIGAQWVVLFPVVLAGIMHEATIQLELIRVTSFPWLPIGANWLACLCSPLCVISTMAYAFIRKCLALFPFFVIYQHSSRQLRRSEGIRPVLTHVLTRH